MASYGENWDRLVELKKRVDPENMFCNTLWPLDAEGNVVDPSEREPPAPEGAGTQESGKRGKGRETKLTAPLMRELEDLIAKPADHVAGAEVPVQVQAEAKA